MPRSLSLILVFSILVSSCASILSGTTETIYVTSDEPGSTIYLNNSIVGTDTATIKISKKRLKKAKLHVVKEGCSPISTGIETRFDNTSLLGLFLDLGVVSILIIDWGTYGAIRQAKKVNYVLTPECPRPE